jgi:hypothetical protein
MERQDAANPKDMQITRVDAFDSPETSHNIQSRRTNRVPEIWHEAADCEPRHGHRL